MSSTRSRAQGTGLPVVPLFVGRDNAVAVIGRSWRAVQDVAAALGVQPRRVGRIALYPARELVDAIERAGASLDADADTGHEPSIDELRRRIARAT